jgi:excisionase family DNA binding protein
MSMAIGDYLTTQEAARELNVSDSRVRQFHLSKRLPGRKVGTMLLFKREDVARFKKKPRPPGAPPA